MSAASAQTIETLTETVEALRDEVSRLRAAFDELAERQEDAEAVAWYDRWKAEETGAGDALPSALVDRLLSGVSPVTVFREHRGLSLSELAERAGTTPSHLDRVEKGDAPLDDALGHALAKVLNVSAQDLTD